MIEIPEAITVVSQINETVVGKKVSRATADHSHHKFTWYYNEPGDYGTKLEGKTIEGAKAQSHLIEIHAGTSIIVTGDGASLRYYEKGAKAPAKHQLLLEFTDGSMLAASVQMYGGIWCFDTAAGEDFDNIYYLMAKEKTSPLSDAFDEEYFKSLLHRDEVQKLSAKAFLATEQRIPGLGNGVLQDILWNARIHPKRKIKSLSQQEIDDMFHSVKDILKDMRDQGGRDTEKDLYGNAGGYITRMSRNNAGNACGVCGGMIHKENYLGGSIYYCDGCQKI